MNQKRMLLFFIICNLQVFVSDARRFRIRFISTGYSYGGYSSNSDLSSGAIIGIAIGSLVGAGLLIFLCCCCCVMICAPSKESGEVIEKEQSTIPAISNTQMSSPYSAANSYLHQQKPVITLLYIQQQPKNVESSAPPLEYDETKI